MQDNLYYSYMRRARRIFIIIGITLTLLLCKGYFFRFCIKYKPIELREGYSVFDPTFFSYIENSVSFNDLHEVKSIIKESNKLTSNTLSFTTTKCSIDPNKLIRSKKTHCIGYAIFYTAVCNYLIDKSNLSNEWIAKTYKGRLYFAGINIHKFFKSPFFKDHDFVIVENPNTGERIYIDPITFDYFGINRVAGKDY